MAYGTRWKIETVNPYTGSGVDVLIRERDYAGAVTDLDPGGDMVAIRYSPIGMFSGTPHWTLAASEATIEFVDDGTGQLIEVLSGDDEKYQVEVSHAGTDLWIGYLVPDSYGYIPYQRGIARVTATDRLGTLFGSPYLQSTGYVYSGRQSIVQIIANCVEKITSGLPYATHMRWYPYIGLNDLATTDNPLEYLFLDNEIFYDEDNNPMSCGFVLEQICGRFQMQMMQGVARWQLHQRRKTIVSNLFTVFLYDADGSPSVVTTTTYQAYTSIDGTINRLASPYMAGWVPYGSVSLVYNHGNPFTDLFSNRSFEETAHGTVTGTPLANSVGAQTGTSLIIDGLTPSVNIIAGMRFSVAGGEGEYVLAESAIVNGSGQTTLSLTFALPAAGIADNAALTFLEDVGNWEFLGSSGFPGSSPIASDGGISVVLSVDFETTPFSYNANNYLRQRSREQVAGGSGFRIIGGWDVFVPELDAVTTEVYMGFEAYIDVGGTPYYYKWTDSTWTTTPTKNEVPLKSFNLGNNKWDTFTFATGTLDDGGTPLTGYLYWSFLEGHEFNGGGSSTTGLQIHIDNFQQPALLDANFLPAGEATQTTITYDGNVNRSKPDVPQFIIGDGPTTAHVRRLTLKSSILADVDDITGDWSYGPSAYASGYTLNQFWADEILKQYRRSARRLTTGVFGTSTFGIPQPWQMLRIENPNDTSTPDYAWMDMEYRPAAPWNILSGTYVEVVNGDSGDRLCEYSVPGSSVAALSLTLEQGIPCASGGVHIEPTVVQVFFGLSNNGETGDTTTGIYSTNADFEMASFQLRLATASRPRIIVPLNSRRQLLYQLDDDQEKIYMVSMDTFADPVLWLSASPDDFEGMAVNELDEEVVITIDDIDSGLSDKLHIYDYDGVFLRGTVNPPITVETGCMGVDSVNRHIYMRHGPGVRAVCRFDLDTLAYDLGEASYPYGGMGPVEYNTVDNQLYWHENAAGNTAIYRKTPNGLSTGDVRLYNGISAFTQMYYSKLHGELLAGNGVALRIPTTGTDVSATSILNGLDINPLCRGICVYEPSGGHTK